MPPAGARNLGTSLRNRPLRKPREPSAHRQPGRGSAAAPGSGWASRILGAGGRAGRKNPLQHRRQNSSLRNAALPARPARSPRPRAGGRGPASEGAPRLLKRRRTSSPFLPSPLRGGCRYTRLALSQRQAYVHPQKRLLPASPCYNLLEKTDGVTGRTGKPPP